MLPLVGDQRSLKALSLCLLIPLTETLDPDLSPLYFDNLLCSAHVVSP